MERRPKAEMLSGHFLGSVLRGADGDQQAADEDVSVPAGNSSLSFTLIRACAESFTHKTRRGRKRRKKTKKTRSFMHCKRFKIKHSVYVKAV